MRKLSSLFFIIALTSCLQPVPVEEVPVAKDETSSATDNSSSSDSTEEESNVNRDIDGGNDPLLVYQWHLDNYGQRGGTSGEDLNVMPLFSSGKKGSGVVVAVVDDGLEAEHNDLWKNFNSDFSYNYINFSKDPTPASAQDYGHGTACAGIIAARDSNDEGGRGVAPRATLVGYNLLAKYSSINTYDAMRRNRSVVDVSNNSWGPPDGYGDLVEAEALWMAGLEDGLRQGRGGKGIVYVFAAGNGGEIYDLSNYDGYASYPGVIAVSAIGDDGRYADYSEMGSNIWVAAPSEGQSETAITTTDLTGSARGYNKSSLSNLSDRDYTTTFNGTSAAAPMVTGVVALMLEENENLSYRDVKAILAKTARKNDPTNGNWTTNAAGLNINYNYGFGAVDATAAVNAASSWTNLPAQVIERWPLAGEMASGETIDDAGTEVTSDIVISSSGISEIEFVQVEVNITHNDWGNLTMYLKRSGSSTTEAVLSLAHPCYNSSFSVTTCTRSNNTYTFGVARFLDEDPNGTWTLSVVDGDSTKDGRSGVLDSWRLKVYGH